MDYIINIVENLVKTFSRIIYIMLLKIEKSNRLNKRYMGIFTNGKKYTLV